MDLSSSNKRSTVNLPAMGASFAENIHEPSSSSKQLFSGISKGSLTTPTNPANDSSNNPHSFSRVGSLTQANPFRPENHSHINTNSSAVQSVTENNLSLKRSISGNNNNITSSTNNSSDNEKEVNITASHNSLINRSNRVGLSSDVNNDNAIGNTGVRYKECLKNHAANMGGYALDGCGEFMPAGEEGSLEALKCAACGCHRNFHRREINGVSLHVGTVPSTSMSLLALPSPINTSNTSTSNTSEYGEGDHAHSNNGLVGSGAGTGAAATGFGAAHYNAGHMGAALLPHLHHHHHHHQYMNAWMAGNKALLQAGAGAAHHGAGGVHLHHTPGGAVLGPGGHAGAAAGVHGQYPTYLGMGPPGHMMGGPGGAGSGSGKRFRTKFTMEQREKMFEFSEKVGWRIQKHDEAAVQQFCAEAGVKRHVLKVWMHNNKNTFGKKLLRFPEAFNAMPESSS